MYISLSTWKYKIFVCLLHYVYGYVHACLLLYILYIYQLYMYINLEEMGQCILPYFSARDERPVRYWHCLTVIAFLCLTITTALQMAAVISSSMSHRFVHPFLNLSTGPKRQSLS